MSGAWAALMRQALELAERGRYGASPNPMVGAVLLSRDGEVVGRGAHLRCGGPHAEIEALAEGGSRAAGGTMVVTLEPCNHQGRTPPCVDAILAAAIARVVIGTRDPNPLVNGSGAEALRTAGVEVVEGVEEEACRVLNRRFFHWIATGQPYVTLKMAMTLDGKLAARGGRSRWITSEASRREGYALREEYDALLVGVNTVLTDDPRLVRHLGLNPNPHLVRAVLDTRLRTPADAAMLEHEPHDIVFFCGEDAVADRRRELEARGAAVVEVGDDGREHRDLRQVLRWLGAQGASSVLVEGGGEVHWSFLHEGLAQGVRAFVAPLVLGGREATSAVGGAGFPSPQDAVRLRFVEVRRLGEDLVLNAEIDRV
jgi:diaminohydroxyphosphoribosylaminopyrimidine deaminase/5-amino-6-(5-phosphoribosylamino)uracil reductase